MFGVHVFSKLKSSKFSDFFSTLMFKNIAGHALLGSAFWVHSRSVANKLSSDNLIMVKAIQ